MAKVGTSGGSSTALYIMRVYSHTGGNAHVSVTRESLVRPVGGELQILAENDGVARACESLRER
jgi:hypothetical protein